MVHALYLCDKVKYNRSSLYILIFYLKIKLVIHENVLWVKNFQCLTNACWYIILRYLRLFTTYSLFFVKTKKSLPECLSLYTAHNIWFYCEENFICLSYSFEKPSSIITCTLKRVLLLLLITRCICLIYSQLILGLGKSTLILFISKMFEHRKSVPDFI